MKLPNNIIYYEPTAHQDHGGCFYFFSSLPAIFPKKSAEIPLCPIYSFFRIRYTYLVSIKTVNPVEDIFLL